MFVKHFGELLYKTNYKNTMDYCLKSFGFWNSSNNTLYTPATPLKVNEGLEYLTPLKILLVPWKISSL